ncbi:MAG: YicC family protein [Lachnospiraceae bacterium]|nr:YicC family protein [Lachnospiraceae bacterium]
MAYSMTGFGHYEYQEENEKLTAVIHSVNHRYLDLSVKLSKKLSAHEMQIRNQIKQKLSRGKVDVTISYESTGSAKEEICYNPDRAKCYIESLRSMAEDFGIPDDISVTKIARLPDVFEIVAVPEDEEHLEEMTRKVLEGALAAFLENRSQEGSRLACDLNEKIDEMEQLVLAVEEREPQIIEEYKSRLRGKIDDLLEDTQIDESRLAMEVTIMADKLCVDEEMVRLKSHIAEARSTLGSSGDIGRKMDFLAQEMNREANTILSKSTDVTVADLGISIKTLIEKIREQIQNLE